MCLIKIMCFHRKRDFTMSTQSKQRDYLFDNYKALLIILVVVGHFIEPAYKNNTLLYTLKWLIFSFHMPAFIFISGYFSKRELPFGTLVRKLAVPYVIYELLYYFMYTELLHKDTGLYLWLPKFSLWYILALFVWRLITPYVKRIPHYMLLAVAAGLLIGCSGMQDNFLSIPRILVFYPFFLAGTAFDRSLIAKLRTPVAKAISAFTFIGFTAFLALAPIVRSYPVKIFYGRYNYDFLGQTIPEGMLVRLACYGISFFLTFALMSLIPDRKNCFSYLGERTMAIYLFHGLTYSYIKSATDWLQNVDTIPESLLLLATCVALSFAFSIPQLTTFTNQLANIHLPKVRLPEIYTPAKRTSKTKHPFISNHLLKVLYGVKI